MVDAFGIRSMASGNGIRQIATRFRSRKHCLRTSRRGNGSAEGAAWENDLRREREKRRGVGKRVGGSA